MSKMSLRKELRSVGAGEHEADQLADMAKLLGNIKTRGLSSETKKRLAPSVEATKKPRTWQWALAGSFATACLLLLIAQSALPGSWLYRVKRGTEEARAAIQPGYKEILVEKREDEVEKLMLKKADPAVLEQAEKQYQDSVEEVHSDNTNYQPRYDWSRRWYEKRSQSQDSGGQTQSWQDRLPTQDSLRLFR